VSKICEFGVKNKNKNKNMQNPGREAFSSQNNSDYSLVYYYLLAGISLLVAVFLFLPRIAVG